MQTLHNYIYFPENIVDDLNNIEKAKTLIKDFQMTIDLADCERGSKLYYSKSNKDKFFDEIKTLDDLSELNFGAYDLETFINTFLIESDINLVEESFDCDVTTFNSKSGGILNKDVPVVLFEIIRREKGLKRDDKQVILNPFNSFISQNPILIIVTCKGKVKTFEVPFVTRFSELDNWLIKNRLTRTYNFGDNRHIENHPKSLISLKGKSPLIGGLEGKNNAELLLKNAIGDKRGKKTLNNFDPTNNCFIQYEYENDNPQNQYHGYHLVKANNHEEDKIAVNRIPKRLLTMINYRKSISEK